jgi:hypothetical protein
VKILTVVLFLTGAIVPSSAVAPTPTKVAGNSKQGKKWFIAQQSGACHLMVAAPR